MVRLASERIALAVETVLQRTVEERPRGAARAIALHALLIGSDEDAARSAPLLGLSPDGLYRVALASRGLDLSVLQKAAGPAAVLHEAGENDGAQVVVVQSRRDAPESRRTTARGGKQLWRGVSPGEGDWLATSAAVTGAAQLPTAYQQAEFISLLLQRRALVGPLAQFDRLAEIGVFRMLYELWGTPALASFVDDALGELRKRDKRGTLRATLLAYLNAGGSQVETAAALGIHRNTLAYRLRQIEGLTGRDPADPDFRLVTHLALVAATLPART
jgi:hypothetical protein